MGQFHQTTGPSFQSDFYAKFVYMGAPPSGYYVYTHDEVVWNPKVNPTDPPGPVAGHWYRVDFFRKEPTGPDTFVHRAYFYQQ
jgi:hypothetical protein